jgi:hypothetical protein
MQSLPLDNPIDNLFGAHISARSNAATVSTMQASDSLQTYNFVEAFHIHVLGFIKQIHESND